jgi:hypothetical protein
MARNVVRDVEGNAIVKLSIPRPLYLLVERMAKVRGVSDRAALRWLVADLSNLVEAGRADFLGPSWMKELKHIRDEHYGAIGAGETINLAKLHRSTRTKSGFNGVYANGKGFRAMARHQNVEKYIGTFDSAEEGAWKRYLYYQEHGLPYGELEIEIAAWRARGDQGTDEQLKRQILEHARDVGTLHIFVDQPAPTDDPYEEDEGVLAGFDAASSKAVLDALPLPRR